MAILQGLFLALSRRLGQLVNTLFGWATQLLFGKVSQDKQIFISGMAFGSVLWLISVLGIAVPSLGTFLLAFVPLPDWVDKNWVRLAMLAVAVVIPLIVGWMGLKMLTPEEQPKTALERTKTVLRGYPYTFGLAITLLLMLVFAPFMMLPLMAKRWVTDHVPLIVESEEYDSILTRLEKTLAEGGWKTTRQPVSWMVSLPTKIMVSLAGKLVDKYVADKLTTLCTDTLEVTLHPADLVISGKKFDIVRVRALLTEQLAFSSVNQTWTKEANDLENRVTELWEQIKAGKVAPPVARQQLKRIEQERNRLDMEFEEWEVLERQQLLVERSLLDGARSGKDVAVSTSSGKFDSLVGAALFGGLVALGTYQARQKEKTAGLNRS